MQSTCAFSLVFFPPAVSVPPVDPRTGPSCCRPGPCTLSLSLSLFLLSLFLFSVCAALSSSSSFHLFPWLVCVSLSCFLLIRSSQLISPCCSLVTFLEDWTIFVAHCFHSCVTFRVCLFSGWFCVDRFRFYLHLCCCSRLWSIFSVNPACSSVFFFRLFGRIFQFFFLPSSSSRTSSVDYCVFCASSHVLSWGRLCALDVGTYPPFVRFLGLEIFSSCWIPGRPIYTFARRWEGEQSKWSPCGGKEKGTYAVRV